jgi:hypothetical protein
LQKEDSDKEKKLGNLRAIELLKVAINRYITQADNVLAMIETTFMTNNDHHAAKAFLLLIIAKNLQTILQAVKEDRRSSMQLVTVTNGQKEFIQITDNLVEKEVQQCAENVQTKYLQVMEELKKYEYLISILSLYPFIETTLEYAMNRIEGGVIEDTINNHKVAENKYIQAKTVIELILEEYGRCEEVGSRNYCKVSNRERYKKLNDKTAYCLLGIYRMLDRVVSK